jgi:hypothetical protein
MLVKPGLTHLPPLSVDRYTPRFVPANNVVPLIVIVLMRPPYGPFVGSHCENTTDGRKTVIAATKMMMGLISLLLE